jgi:hypothetical protein
MTWSSWLEFARVMAVFLVAYVALPFVITAPARTEAFFHRVAAAFVRVSVFLVVAVMGLGVLRLARPGAITAAYVLWALSGIVWFRRHRSTGGEPGLRGTLLTLLARVEHEAPPRRATSPTSRSRLSASAAIFLLLVVTTLFHRLDQPLRYFRFFHIETYGRVLSLAALESGQPWKPDGASALLAPLAYWSGLGPGAVTRAAGPLFALLLPAAAAFCAFRISRKRSAAFVAFGLVAIAPLLSRDPHPGEPVSTALAAVFWLFGAAFVRDSWKLALASAATALLIDWHPNLVLLSVLVCTLLGVGAARFEELLRRLPALRPVLGGVLAAAFILTLCMGFHSPIPEGPFQYEAAARNAHEIARRFPRNSWLIVSPSHELAYICGRGWHVELVDFVSTFSTDQVSQAGFSFPYYVQDVFFFLEKRPIRSEGMVPVGAALTGSFDPAVRAYHTVSGRQAIEFQAAKLLAAYGRTHNDLSTVYEDDSLVVYRAGGVVTENQGQPPLSRARLTGKASSTR